MIGRAIAVVLVFAWGVPAQTPVLVKDIYPGNTVQSGNPTGLTDVGGFAVFAARTLADGVELWRTNGTTANTGMVLDILPGRFDSNPRGFEPMGGRVYFAAANPLAKYNLWMSDGTAAGTRLLFDAPGFGSGPRELTAVAGQLFFVDDTTSSSKDGLYRTDGTTAGTTLLSTFDTGTVIGPRFLTAVGDRLFFAAWTARKGYEPWVSDGTVAGTRLLADIRTAFQASSSPSEFVAFRGKCYFAANDGVYGRELWVSDGTPAGTRLFLDVEVNADSEPSQLTVVGNELYFIAKIGGVWQLAKTDGTAQNTAVIRPVVQPDATRPMHALRDILLFTGLDGEPWRSDGTPAGTHPLRDINPSGRSLPQMITNRDRGAWFRAYDGRDQELWFTDGTPRGTRLVADIRPGPLPSSPLGFALSGGRLLFSADDGIVGRELWTLSIDAFVHPVGRGRGDSLRTPTFGMGVPRIGRVSILYGHDAAPGTNGTVLASPLLQPPIAVVPGSELFVSPAAFGVLTTFSAAASSWSASVPVPSDTRLVGAVAALQAFFAPSAAPLGIDFTNAMHVRIGR